MFLSFLGLGIVALEIGDRNVKRLVPEPDSDDVHGRNVGNFRIADNSGSGGPRSAVIRPKQQCRAIRVSPNAAMTPRWLFRGQGRSEEVLDSSFLDRMISLPSVSEPRCQCLQNRLFPTLPVAIIPWLPPALITTVSISKPFSTTTKFAATGGRPSVKLIVKVPVQSEFTV